MTSSFHKSATSDRDAEPADDIGQPGIRARQKKATRRALIAAARALFTQRGYHNVGVREFVAAAGVTRGSLYHHFGGGKEDLFLAVFDEVEREIMMEAARLRAGSAGQNSWERFRKGIQAYLDAVTRPDLQRITLIDGPVVLGWAKWRQLEEQYGLGALSQALKLAMNEKLIRVQPVEPLAHLLLGSVMEAAMLIAHSDEQNIRRVEVGSALDSLLRGLE